MPWDSTFESSFYQLLGASAISFRLGGWTMVEIWSRDEYSGFESVYMAFTGSEGSCGYEELFQDIVQPHSLLTECEELALKLGRWKSQ